MNDRYWLPAQPVDATGALVELARSIERATNFAANDEVKASYLQLAKQWHELAQQLEAGRLTVAVSVDPELAVFLRNS